VAFTYLKVKFAKCLCLLPVVVVLVLLFWFWSWSKEFGLVYITEFTDKLGNVVCWCML